MKNFVNIPWQCGHTKRACCDGIPALCFATHVLGFTSCHTSTKRRWLMIPSRPAVWPPINTYVRYQYLFYTSYHDETQPGSFWNTFCFLGDTRQPSVGAYTSRLQSSGESTHFGQQGAIGLPVLAQKLRLAALYVVKSEWPNLTFLVYPWWLSGWTVRIICDVGDTGDETLETVLTGW